VTKRTDYHLCSGDGLHALIILPHPRRGGRRTRPRTICAPNLDTLRIAANLSGPLWSRLIKGRLTAPPKELNSLALKHIQTFKKHPDAVSIKWLKGSDGWQPSRTNQRHTVQRRATVRKNAVSSPMLSGGPPLPAHHPLNLRKHGVLIQGPATHLVMKSDVTGEVLVWITTAQQGGWAASVQMNGRRVVIGGPSPSRVADSTRVTDELHAFCQVLHWLPPLKRVDLRTNSTRALRVIARHPPDSQESLTLFWDAASRPEQLTLQYVPGSPDLSKIGLLARRFADAVPAPLIRQHSPEPHPY